MNYLNCAHIPENNFSRPLVSWVLCSNVENNHLKLSIESCLSQTYDHFELVFIANGQDATRVAQAVRGWFGTDTRVRVFETSIHQLSFSLSLGLHHARGTLIARMDSDDISSSNRLEQQVAFMSERPDVLVLGTNYEIIDNEGTVKSKVILPESDKLIRQALIRGNPFCHPSVMFRRQVILEAGGYLGGLHAEDYDLWARLSLNPNCRFANLSKICLGYRVIGIGFTRRSRWAYASTASSQFRNFLVGGGLRWLFASVISVIKLILRLWPIRTLK
jgi:glycosyltransferase involved in cell wall biosynthesis